MYNVLMPALHARYDQRFEQLEQALRPLAAGFDGRVGIGVRSASGLAQVHGDQRFPMQSVMKIVVAAAVMEAIDHRGWRFEEPVRVRRQDLSLHVQPLADLVNTAGADGYRTTLGDLISRAVIDSDSAATDILFARVGGAAGIGYFLRRHGITGVRVDRDERHLQTETAGMKWCPEFVDAAVFAKVEKAVPTERRAAAFQAYLKDPRDTATPAGMAFFLYKLATGQILSPESTKHLLAVMRRTVTFPDRLKAGVPPDWTLGHKTGTSGTWEGVTAATNDVGVLVAPGGEIISVAVFIAASRRSATDRAALIAQVARVITGA